MNSLSSLLNDQGHQRSKSLRKSINKQPNIMLLSPENSLLSQCNGQFRLRSTNSRQSKTHSIGFKPILKLPFQLAPIKPIPFIEKEKIKYQQDSYSIQTHHKSQQERLFTRNQSRIEKGIEQIVIEKKEEEIVTPQKFGNRKTKITRLQKQNSDAKQLQYNLRIQIPNNNSDVSTLMDYYNRKMKLPEFSKVFIFNSQDDYIKRVLVHWGWVENKIIDSPFYHLKWIYIDTPNDHKNVLGQIFNHFKNNQEMTSKGGLIKNMRNNNMIDQRLQDFIPRSYDLGNPADCDTFYFDYQRNTMISILKKHYKLIKQKVSSQIINRLVLEIKSHQVQEKRRWRKKHYQDQSVRKNNKDYISKYVDEENKNDDFLVNIHLLLICLRYCRYQIKSNENQDWNNPKGFLNFDREQFIKAFPSILKYSRMNYPINLQKISSANKSHYNTPSLKMIKSILKYYLYFQSKNKYTWHSDGQNNVWVIKPANNARGNGIYLHNDCFEIINSSEGYSRIVQKYIQNPLICCNPSYPLIYNSKFDIRQWVLVTSFNPLKAWMFSSCYLRICSETYDINDFKNLQRHLTNYSFNKNNFVKKQQSIQSLQNFKQYLLSERNVNWDHTLKPQIMTIIYNTLISCADSISDTNNKFQLYGFDILIDDQLKPWLLEVNLSPACEERTDFLKQYCECMGEQLLRIVMPSTYCGDTSLNPNQHKYRWQKLPECYEQKRKDDLQIIGTKINYKNQKLYDIQSENHRAAIIVQSIFKMIKPKQQLKQLKKIKISKQIQKYFLQTKHLVNYVQYQKQQTISKFQQFLTTTNTLINYQKLLRNYYIKQITEKYLHSIHAIESFKAKRLNQAVKNIQSIYQHYQCLKIIVDHRYYNSMAKKIQKQYRKHYQQRTKAANVLKKYMKLHLYQKKRKQFLHELQVYSNTITIQVYLRSLSSYSIYENRIANNRINLIQNGMRRLLATRKHMSMKLKIFDRQVGRVLRVITRRTRTYYFPDIKEYVSMTMKIALKLEKYLGVYRCLLLTKKKNRKRKTKILASYFKSLLSQLLFRKKYQKYTQHQSNSKFQILQKQQIISQSAYKNKVSLPKIQSAKTGSKPILKKKVDDEQVFNNYLSKAKQIRRKSCINSRNNKKQ